MKVKITNYNTHLFFNTIVELGPKSVYEDEIRLNKIIALLSKSSSDIISLNELWADSTKEKIKNNLADKFDAWYPPNKKSQFKIGSGLMILCRKSSKLGMKNVNYDLSIHNPSFTQYNHLSGTDDMSQKGFITATIMKGSKPFLKLITTHNQADATPKAISTRRTNFQQIYDTIGSSGKKDLPVFFTGDMNVIGESNEYKTIKSKFSGLGMVDAYKTANPTLAVAYGYTYNGVNNKLIPIFVPGDSNARQRLDYIFYNANSANIEVDEVKVVRTQMKYSSSKANELMDLSDHYPLTGTFIFK